MKTRKLTLVMAIMALLVLGFVAVPVVSGEHPWDADRPDDGKDFDPDDYPWLPGGNDTIEVNNDNDTVTNDGDDGGNEGSYESLSGTYDLLRLAIGVYFDLM